MIELTQTQLEKRLARMPMPEISEEEYIDLLSWEMKSYSATAALVAIGKVSTKELKQIAKRVKENMIFTKRFDEFKKIAAPIWDNKRNAFICYGLNK